MKKTLLLSLGLVAAAPAVMAEFQAPTIHPDASFQHISPNGRYLVSEVMGTLVVYDLNEGTEQRFAPADEYSLETYTAGNGHSIANNGVLAGGMYTNEAAYYVENGEWKPLSTTGAKEGAVNLASAITPDASRICGGLGIYQLSIDDDVTMMVPVYWDRLEDGTYSEPQRLPAPTKDPLGTAPQYVTAVDISADGKVIAGQVTVGCGMLHVPIVYIQAEDGTWTYKYVMPQTCNPNHLELPYLPEGPARPSPEQYMTEEALAEFQAAYQAWIDSQYQLPYPNQLDYLTEEGKEAYNKAMAEYQVVADEWEVLSVNYYSVLGDILDSSIDFTLNSVRLSPDGKKYYTFASLGSYWEGGVYDVTYVCDIATDEYETYGSLDLSLGLCDVPANGVFMAWDSQYTGYIVKDGVVTPVNDYVCSFSPEMKSWYDDNMTHLVESMDWDTGEIIEEEVSVGGGMPIASEDLSIIASSIQYPTWNYELTSEGYLFNLAQFTGVADVATEAEGSISVDTAGNIVVKGEVALLEVYSLGGVNVLTVVQPAGVVNTNFAKGVYVAKATLANGSAVTAKLVK